MNNDHSKYFERIKQLYDNGKIDNLSNYIEKGLISDDEASEILDEEL